MLSRRLTFCPWVCLCGGRILLYLFTHLSPSRDRWPSSLHIKFLHTGASILTRSLYPNIVQWFCTWYGFLVFALWFYLFWGLCEKGSLCLCVLSLFCRAHFKHTECSFECCHMVDSFSAWYSIILVWPVSVHYDVIHLRFFHFWDHMGLRFWCICLFPFNYHFWQFFISWFNC